MPYHENLDEFLLRHGGDPAQTTDRNDRKVLVCPDGARVTYNRLGATFQEQPPDPRSLQALSARRHYHQLKLEAAEIAFNAIKRIMAGTYVGFWTCDGPAKHIPGWRPEFGPEPAYPDAAALARLKKIAAPHRQALRELERLIENHPDTLAQRQAHEAMQQEQERRLLAAEKSSLEIQAITMTDEEDQFVEL